MIRLKKQTFGIWLKKLKRKTDINHREKEAIQSIIKLRKLHNFSYWFNHAKKNQYLKLALEKSRLYFADKWANRLTHKCFKLWRKYNKLNKLKRANVEEQMVEASNYYCTRLLTICFQNWRIEAKSKINRLNRAKLHSIFTGWKFVTREKKMLKKYLKESKLDEEYSITPLTTYRYDLPKLVSESQMSPISLENLSASRGSSTYQGKLTFFSPLAQSDKLQSSKGSDFPQKKPSYK